MQPQKQSHNHLLHKTISRFLTLCALLGTALNARAAETVEQHAPIVLKTCVEYAYNYTYGHYGNLDFIAAISLNRYCDMGVGVQASTANIYSAMANVCPKFPVRVGEFFVDTRFIYRAVVRSTTHDLSAMVSLGYRMDYISLQFGALARMMDDMNREWQSEDKIMVEPVNLLYAIEVFVRPQSSRWNLSFRMANFNDFRTERMWQPMFMINTHCLVADHWRMLAGVELKPTGMFHLDASFYEAMARVGFAYEF